MDRIRKIYIEPTSRCNLDCRICARHTWTGEETGDMSPETFRRILEFAQDSPAVETLFFGGVAEPFSHPDILDMLRQALRTGKRVESITNGVFLTLPVIRELVDMGLDMLWVSIDLDHQDSMGGKGILEDFRARLRTLYNLAYQAGGKTRFGIMFVAGKSNIHALPEVLGLANAVRASALMVTNLIPYEPSLEPEILYGETLRVMGHADNVADLREKQGTAVSLPIMDFKTPEVSRILAGVMGESPHLRLGTGSILRKSGQCPFVEGDSISIRWDGDVAPCAALLHNNSYHLSGTKRCIRRCSFGNVGSEPLGAIWEKPDYVDFRNRVRAFEFPPCTICGHCSLAEDNLEDCFGNPFPTCGGCLWAEGLIQCP